MDEWEAYENAGFTKCIDNIYSTAKYKHLMTFTAIFCIKVTYIKNNSQSPFFSHHSKSAEEMDNGF